MLLFGYSGIIFCFLNESTIRQMKSQKIAKEYRESTIKKLNEQGKSIKNLVENLDQGFMVFDQRGVILEGATAITKDFFGVDPEGKILPEILQIKDHKTFFLWVKNIYKGVIPLKTSKL